MSMRKVLLLAGLLAALVLPLAPLPAQAVPVVDAAKAGTCKGFKNRVGMTNKVIRIANVVDRTGPVPNLHVSARQAVRAYVAYFNAHHRICGRKLAVTLLDSATDAGADQSAYVRACRSAFAAVGSMSVFDSGGAAAAQRCGLPDLRAASMTRQRNACRTCFGVDATRAGVAPNSVPDFVVASRPDAVQKAAMLHLNAGDVPERAATLRAVAAQRGFQFVYSSAIDVADFNLQPYVQQLKSKGVRVVQYVGSAQQAARLALAMADAEFHPEVFLADTALYGTQYPALAGEAGEGTVVPIEFVPLSSNGPEMKRYRTWLAKVAPGATPTREGLYAWSATRLFVTEARALGRRLTRATLVARLRAVQGWAGAGLHAPQAVGAKQVSPCARLLVLKDGRWVSAGGTAYRCSGLSTG